MIDEQVAGDGGDPGDERAFGAVVAGQGAIHLDEDLLGEVLGVVGGSGEAVADVIDTPVVGLNDFFPGSGVAGNTAADQHRDYLNVFQTMLPGKAAVRCRLSAISYQLSAISETPSFERTPHKTVRGCSPASSPVESSRIRKLTNLKFANEAQPQ